MTVDLESDNKFEEGYIAGKRESRSEISSLKEEIKKLKKKIKKLKDE